MLKPYLECLATGKSIKNNALYIVAGGKRTVVHRLYLPYANDGKTVDAIILGLFCMEGPARYQAKYPTKLHLQ